MQFLKIYFKPIYTPTSIQFLFVFSRGGVKCREVEVKLNWCPGSSRTSLGNLLPFVELT